MTRTAATKLVATALAVASLGLASSAQAAEQNIAIGEPTPGQPVPAQPDQGTGAENAGNEAPEKAVDPVEEVDYTSPEYFKSPEAKQRFERYCNMKNAEPSHSDKKFCEDYRKHNGTTTTTTSTGSHKCNENGTREYCKPYPKPEPKPEPGKPVYPTTQPTAEKADKGSLPFTGLEIWQLGLIGIVLAGGGFGARRLLAS